SMDERRGPTLSFPPMLWTRTLLVSATALLAIACGGSSAETSARTPAPASTVTPTVWTTPSPSSGLAGAVPAETSTPTPTSAATRASLRRRASLAASPSAQAAAAAAPGAPPQPGDQNATLRSQGVSAVCNDGSYSHSRHRQGTCSHHQGV